MKQRLVILNGPIGAGKSAVASELAALLRQSGKKAAVVGLDEFYHMLSRENVMDDSWAWRAARKAAAAATDSFLASGSDVAICEGPFWNHQERSGFLDSLRSESRAVFVTLRVSCEDALLRVTSDPNRTVSKDPEFLKSDLAEFDAEFRKAVVDDHVIDTTGLTAKEVAACIIGILGN